MRFNEYLSCFEILMTVPGWRIYLKQFDWLQEEISAIYSSNFINITAGGIRSKYFDWEKF